MAEKGSEGRKQWYRQRMEDEGYTLLRMPLQYRKGIGAKPRCPRHSRHMVPVGLVESMRYALARADAKGHGIKGVPFSPKLSTHPLFPFFLHLNIAKVFASCNHKFVNKANIFQRYAQKS